MECMSFRVCTAGQVHGGKLHDGRRFAMKIQYPGVARSIESDVDNLMRLIKIANLLPKGLYVEQAAEVTCTFLSNHKLGCPIQKCMQKDVFYFHAVSTAEHCCLSHRHWDEQNIMCHDGVMRQSIYMST